MPFYFTCPYCYKKTLVDESISGQSGLCAVCGKQITIPSKNIDNPVQATRPSSDEYQFMPRFRSNRIAWVGKSLTLLLVVCVGSYLALFFLAPAYESLKQRRNKISCMNNLRQIANAMNSYAAEHGNYPPAVVYDPNGKPLHSWRTLLLKHLGEEALHAEYKFDEPWDSQHNLNLLPQCPDVFISPAAASALRAETSYMLVTGKDTVFPSPNSLSPKDIGDGLGKTLLIVEVKNGIHEWTKPIDIDVTLLNHTIGGTGSNAIGGNHADGATAVFCDGTSAWLPTDLDPILLDAVLTPNGNEPVETNNFQLK